MVEIDIKDIKLTNVKMILDEYALKYEELIKKNLEKHNKVASGNLMASIHTSLIVNGEKYTIYLNSKEYLKYIETGTKPHWPPTENILTWVRDKRLPTQESTGDKSLPTEKQLTYLIKRKISEKGTDAVPIIAETEEELNEIYSQKLIDALNEDIINWMPIINIELNFK